MTSTKMNSISVHRGDATKYQLNPADTFGETAMKALDMKLGGVSVQTHQAGHDATLILTGLEGNPNQAILAVADGHGPLGHLHSYAAIRLLAKHMVKFIPIFLRHLTRPTPLLSIQGLVEYAYQKVQEEMTPGPECQFPELDTFSGTTMAMALVLTVNGHRQLISTNAGDSQIIWSPSLDSEPTECSIDHNCDNPEAVSLYLKRLAKMRRELDKDDPYYLQHHKRLQPKPIYYSRINCGGPIWDMFTDKWGQPAPINVYKYEGVEKNTPVLDRDNYENISFYYPHGSQSRRNPPTYVREDGRTVAVVGREMENWGSTLNGEVQTLNGFGDLYQSIHHSATPSVSITPIDTEGRLVLASDGLTDLFHFKELMDWFWHQNDVNDEDSDSLDQCFYDYLFKTVAPRDNSYPSREIEGVYYPRWDDVSGIFSTLPDMKCVNRNVSERGQELFRETHD